jgi:type II secretory pathway pseudopilin PulG
MTYDKLKAITLIEALVAVSIISLMVSILYPFYVHKVNVSKDFACKSSQQGLYMACYEFSCARERFPLSQGGEWKEELSIFYNNTDNIMERLSCPEREELGIIKAVSDFGLNTFLSATMKDSSGEVVKKGVKVSDYAVPYATYLLADSVTFSFIDSSMGSTGNGQLDPYYFRPDRRHMNFSHYNMTFSDGHTESIHNFMPVIRFPEWLPVKR